MIGAVLDAIVSGSPGGFLVGGLAVALGGALVWHVAGSQRAAWRERRAVRAARVEAAKDLHPAYRGVGGHRGVRVVRRRVRPVAPLPRVAVDGLAWRLPPAVGVARVPEASRIPGPRCGR